MAGRVAGPGFALDAETGLPPFRISASRSSKVFGLVSAFFGGAFVTTDFLLSAFLGRALVSTFFGGVLVITGFGVSFFSGLGSGFGSGLDLISGAGSEAASGSGSEAGAGPPARSIKVRISGFGVHPRKDDNKIVRRIISPCAMETRPNTFFAREFFTF